MSSEPIDRLPGLDVRDRQEPSSRGTAKGGLVAESHAVFFALAQGLPPTEVRDEILGGRLFQKTSIATRRSIWMALRHRYFSADPIVAQALVDASRSGVDSIEFRSLAYLYYALRDRVVFEFVTEAVWRKWYSRATGIDSGEFLAFVDDLSVNHPNVKHWRESTRIRLGRNIFAALRDFGLLKGIQKKTIQQPTVDVEALFHLLSVLWSEGKRASAILDAADWRLFLLSENQVAEHLTEMARRAWIRFERSGRVVILEMRRSLEVR